MKIYVDDSYLLPKLTQEELEAWQKTAKVEILPSGQPLTTMRLAKLLFPEKGEDE